MTDRYSIPAAKPLHLERLTDIELAAAQLLSGHAPPSGKSLARVELPAIAADKALEETTPQCVLAAAMRRGHLWVALDDHSPVGFAHVEMLGSDLPHLEEIDVHPTHGRRGLGTRLVRAVCDWVAAAGYEQITLTTFRSVPWNMPWYARLGFVTLQANQWPDELRRQVASETARGLDPDCRVVIAYRCARR